MRVNSGITVPFVKKDENKGHINTSGYTTTKMPDRLSYLDIPKIAFAGNLLSSPIDDPLDVDSVAVTIPVTVNNSRINLRRLEVPSQRETQMFVNPQDPLVTKPELMTFYTAKPIKPGPAEERIRIVDRTAPLAKPNIRGNFIYPENSPQFDQVHTFAIVKKTFDMYQDLLGRKIKWAFPYKKQLDVYPHAGNKMNAYYSRKDGAIILFQFKRPDTGKIVKFCQSSDIVSHETGHATLDGLKPLFNDNYGFGVNAFHEAFADT